MDAAVLLGVERHWIVGLATARKPMGGDAIKLEQAGFAAAPLVRAPGIPPAVEHEGAAIQLLVARDPLVHAIDGGGQPGDGLGGRLVQPLAADTVPGQGMAPVNPAVVGDGAHHQQPAQGGVEEFVVLVLGVGQMGTHV